MDLEIKKKLLEMLMDDMDKAEVTKLKPKAVVESTPIAAIGVTEAGVIEPEDMKEKIKDMMADKEGSESPCGMEIESESEDTEDDDGESRLMEKLKDLRRLKKE